MKSRVTSKNGDAGTTRTLAGDIVPKSNVLIECSGRLDALRAHTALVRLRILEARAEDSAARAEFLFWLLHVYFLLGTQINDPENKHPEYRKEELAKKHLERLETEQERLEATLKLPKAFIVSASTLLSAELDFTTTLARDLERSMVRLKEAVPNFDTTHLLPFVNRLSDYLFVLARHCEHGKHTPVDYGALDA